MIRLFFLFFLSFYCTGYLFSLGVLPTALHHFYEAIHPLEVTIWGDDVLTGHYKDQTFPKECERAQNKFVRFQEDIWELEEGINSLKTELLEMRTKSDLYEKQNKKYALHIPEDLSLAVRDRENLLQHFNEELLQKKERLYEIMSKGEICSLKPLSKHGVHSSYVIVLLYQDMAVKVIAKTDRVLDGGADTLAEIAAYELDQLWEFHLVPMVVERLFDGKRVSLQYFVKGAVVARALSEADQAISAKLMRFDYLIKQWDRVHNPGNYMYIELQNPYLFIKFDKLIAIDHGAALRAKNGLHHFEIKHKLNIDSDHFNHFVDSDYENYQRIKRTTEKDLEEKVPHLAPDRREMVMRHIEKFVSAVDRERAKSCYGKGCEEAFFTSFGSKK